MYSQLIKIRLIKKRRVREKVIFIIIIIIIRYVKVCKEN